jgi:hypothetical protein
LLPLQIDFQRRLCERKRMGSGKRRRRRVSSNSETLGFDLSSAVMITPLGSPERERERERRNFASKLLPKCLDTHPAMFIYPLSCTHAHVSWCRLRTLLCTTIPHLLATESETPFMFLKRIYIGFITVFCQAVVFLQLHNFLRGCTWQKGENLGEIRFCSRVLFTFVKAFTLYVALYDVGKQRCIWHLLYLFFCFKNNLMSYFLGAVDNHFRQKVTKKQTKIGQN